MTAVVVYFWFQDDVPCELLAEELLLNSTAHLAFHLAAPDELEIG